MNECLHFSAELPLNRTIQRPNIQSRLEQEHMLEEEECSLVGTLVQSTELENKVGQLDTRVLVSKQGPNTLVLNKLVRNTLVEHSTVDSTLADKYVE